MTHPIIVTKPAPCNAHLRPYRSASQDATKHPTKHPPCNVAAMLEERSAFSFARRFCRPYLLCSRISVCIAQAAQIRDLHLELFQFEHTTNCANVKTEEHTEMSSQLNKSIAIDSPNELDASKHIPAKTGRRGHGKGAPSVDLMGILLDSIVLDNEPNKLCSRADRISHGELFERRQTSNQDQKRFTIKRTNNPLFLAHQRNKKPETPKARSPALSM
jgi:hypothetical protein